MLLQLCSFHQHNQEKYVPQLSHMKNNYSASLALLFFKSTFSCGICFSSLLPGKYQLKHYSGLRNNIKQIKVTYPRM